MDILISINRKKFSFLLSFAAAFIAHSFLLFNSYSINNMDSYILFESAVQPRSGRYIGWLFQKFLTSLGFYTVIKPANILVSLVLMSIIVMLIIELLDIKNKINILLISTLFVTAPCIIQILGFNFVCHFDLFSMLLMVLSTYLCIKIDMKIIPIILFWVSLGIYQAYIPLGIFLTFAYFFVNIIRNEDIKKLVFAVLKVIIVFVIGLLLYVIGNRIFLNTYNISMDSYQNLGKNVFSDISILGYLDRIRLTYVHIVDVITANYGNVCNFPLLSYVLVILMVATIIRLFINQNINNFNKIILAILLILSPMLFDFSFIMAGVGDNRIQTSLFFLIIFPVIIDDNLKIIDNIEQERINDIKNKFYVKLIQFFKKIYNNSIKIGAIIFALMFLFISVAEHYNLMIYSKDMERDVEHIVNMIYNNKDYKDGMRIMVVGTYHRLKNEGSMKDARFFRIHNKPIIEFLTGRYSMEQYFKMYGSTNIEWIVADNIALEYADMPCFPSDGCMKKINDNDFVIKFG